MAEQPIRISGAAASGGGASRAVCFSRWSDWLRARRCRRGVRSTGQVFDLTRSSRPRRGDEACPGAGGGAVASGGRHDDTHA